MTIPKGVKSIGERAFGSFWNKSTEDHEKVSDFRIYCNKDSAGEKFAIDYELDYILIEDMRSLSDCTITLASDAFTYDGTEKKPIVTIKDGPAELAEGTDYTVSYSDNTNAGTGMNSQSYRSRCWQIYWLCNKGVHDQCKACIGSRSDPQSGILHLRRNRKDSRSDS